MEVLKDLSLVVKDGGALRFLAHPAVEKLSYYACLQGFDVPIVAVF